MLSSEVCQEFEGEARRSEYLIGTDEEKSESLIFVPNLEELPSLEAIEILWLGVWLMGLIL